MINTEDGVKHMCKVLEDMRTEIEQETTVGYLKNLMESMNIT